MIRWDLETLLDAPGPRVKIHPKSIPLLLRVGLYCTFKLQQVRAMQPQIHKCTQNASLSGTASLDKEALSLLNGFDVVRGVVPASIRK